MFDLRPTRLAQLSGERPSTSTRRRQKRRPACGSGLPKSVYVMEVIQGTKRSEGNSEAARFNRVRGSRTRWTKAVRTKDDSSEHETCSGLVIVLDCCPRDHTYRSTGSCPCEAPAPAQPAQIPRRRSRSDAGCSASRGSHPPRTGTPHFVGKSVVVNVQTPIVRVLSSNPA